ncbi:hypothetical protein BvRS1_28060 [Burkholderia vietnamiensis]|nr:hypothetical protein BvRS1_28060 [Burkholderia vietnamiensis]
MQPEARHGAVAPRDVLGAQRAPHRFDAGRAERDVVDGAGARGRHGLVAEIGGKAARGGRSAADQVPDSVVGFVVAGVEPRAREVERRAVAALEAEHPLVEPARPVEVERADRVVRESRDRHGELLVYRKISYRSINSRRKDARHKAGRAPG